MKKIWVLLLTILVTAFSPAQANNDNSIVFIVPQSIGTTTDAMARHIAAKLEKETGLSVLVEYAVGGDQIVAYNRMKTLNRPALMLGGTSLHVYGFVLNPQALGDIDNHLEILAKVAHAPIIWYTTPQSGIKNLRDLTDAFKKNQRLTVATDVLGIRINPESFKQHFQASNAVVVAYKSSAQSLVDVVGGHADIGTQTPSPTLINLAREGKVVLLANSSTESMIINGQVVPPAGRVAPQFVTSWFLSTAKKNPVSAEVKIAIAKILRDPSTKKFIEDLSVVADSLDSAAAVTYQNNYRNDFRLLTNRVNLIN